MREKRPRLPGQSVLCVLWLLLAATFACAQSAPTISSVQWDPVAIEGQQCASGTGFGSTAGTISLNGSNLTPSQWSDTQACAVIPDGTATGAATLQIVNAAGSSNSFGFTVTDAVPTVASITPSVAGAGIAVTIVGTNFGGSEGNSSVQLQGQTFQISTWSDTQVVAIVPTGIAPGGIYTVSVTVAGVTVTGGLTIVGAPQITSVQWDPVALTGTQCVSGSGFGSSAGTVVLNGSSLSPSLWTDTQACAVVPGTATAGPANLQLVNGAGPGNTVAFNVTASVPAITNIAPATAGAGVPVTIGGSGFGDLQGNSFVQLNGQGFAVSSWSDSQIVAMVPAGITAGATYAVNITVAGVTVSSGLTIVPTPQINSVQWDPVGLGGIQCLSGAGFGSAAGMIVLNGTPLTPSFWTDTQACALIPAATTVGPASVQVVNAGGSSNAIGFAVTSTVPVLSSIAPATAGSGISVTITGSGFGAAQGGGTVVMLGQAFGIVSWADNQIVATVPAGIVPGGIYSVNITVAGVTVSGGLTIVGVPQVNSVQWDPVGLGGTQCVTGTGFGVGTGTISVNGASLTPSLWTDTQACVVIPGSTLPGPATLQVENGAGPGNSVGFTVTSSEPAITGIAPSTAATGLQVTITGSGFGSSQGGSFVQFQSQMVPISTWSGTQIVVTVPAGIVPGSYSLGVTVNGVAAMGNLTIDALPQITSLSPVSGAAGTAVNIAGSNFGQNTGTITFNGIAAAAISWSDTGITAVVPGGAFTGNVIVTTNPGLASNPAGFAVISANPALDADIVNRVSNIDPNRLGNSMQTLANFGTRNACSSLSGGTSGIAAARDWIMAQFSALPGVQTAFYNFSTNTCGGTRTLQDVVAWIPGTGHPNRLIILGGHYDSRTVNVLDGTSPAPGANDSGSQTSLVLEEARVLAGGSYDATLVFVAWTAEEQGLLGSANFVPHYKTLFPNGTIEFNLNCDIVGGDNTANTGAALQQFRLFSPGTPRETSTTAVGSTDNTSPSRLIMHFIGDWGSQYAPGMTMQPNLREDRPGRGSDHESFIVNSIPGVRFIDTAENMNHQHTASDLFTFVTPVYTAGIAQVVVAVAAAAAQAPTPPQSFSAVLTDSDHVNAAWTAPRTGPPVDHYVIAARPITENFYHARVLVSGSKVSAKVRIVEDLGIPAGASFYISVAAVDAAGHESIFAYPEYRCTTTGCAVPAGALNVTATR